MNLIDVLERKTIVENDEDDEMEENGARQGDIIRKFIHGLPKLLESFDEDIVGDVLFDSIGGAAAHMGDGYNDVIEALNKLLKINGVDLKKNDSEAFIKLFKKMGLSRGDALFVIDQNS